MRLQGAAFFKTSVTVGVKISVVNSVACHESALMRFKLSGVCELTLSLLDVPSQELMSESFISVTEP